MVFKPLNLHGDYHRSVTGRWVVRNTDQKGIKRTLEEHAVKTAGRSAMEPG
jgi:shikimate 5-dehydrogenase